MTTQERAAALAAALEGFSGWAPVSAADLVALVAAELGHPGALDGFAPRGAAHARAIPRSPVLHILAGNTPAAALQSLTRGLLVGAHNLAKLPSDAPGPAAAVEAFLTKLPESLSAAVECATSLPDDWLPRAGAVVVFGADQTIDAVRANLRPGQVFQPHGHAVSLALVLDDPQATSAPALAADVAAYSGDGCLTPQNIYLHPDAGISPLDYARQLASALDAAVPDTNPEPAPALAAEIANLRASYTFRAANDPLVAVHHSTEPAGYTVIAEPDPLFASSPGLRTVFVKPLPSDLDAALRFVRPHLSSIAVHPDTPEARALAFATGATRVCPAGQTQQPPLSWCPGGQQQLAPLVSWHTLG